MKEKVKCFFVKKNSPQTTDHCRQINKKVHAMSAEGNAKFAKLTNEKKCGLLE